MLSNSNSQYRILVVDDESIVHSFVSDALEDDGFNILTASNGMEALEIFEREPVDLLITDIRMPKMDGVELVKRAKAIKPDLMVIYMTGYANLNSAKDAIKQGASDYIMKPFELNEIRQAVYKAIDQIKKEAKVSTSEEQLDRINDLNQMLFTVGDKKSLITVSLKFALMQLNASCGSVLYWDSNQEKFHKIIIKDDVTTEQEISGALMSEALSKANLLEIQTPFLVKNDQDHPLYKNCDDEAIKDILFPVWKEAEQPMLVVPISRTYSIYGLLMVDTDKTTIDEKDTNIKFLTITAHQLAMSLENLELLEESQKAYTQLKEMQDQTIQLEKMATKGELSAEIGHELNNFLGVVAGNISLMEFQLKKANITSIDKYLKSINDNIGKIKKFTANLMDLRPIAGKKEMIDFGYLLSEVIEYLQPQKRFREVEIEYNPCEEPLLMEADTTHLQQVLYNLFNNAADAMSQSNKKLLTVATRYLAEDNKFRLYIKDTGIGFKEENLEKAFNQKFTTKENGHGFGLLVCKRIIESHEGEIFIDSVPNEGSTIHIDFKLAHTFEEEPAAV